MQSKGRAQFLPASAKIVSDWHGSEYAITALSKSLLKGSRGPLLSRRRFGWPQGSDGGQGSNVALLDCAGSPGRLTPGSAGRITPTSSRIGRLSAVSYVHYFIPIMTPFCSEITHGNVMLEGIEMVYKLRELQTET
jgi:hypothetical protein